MSAKSSWVPVNETALVVLVSGSQQLRDEAARVAAAAGVDLILAASVAEAQLLRPAVFLLGADSASGRMSISTEIVLLGLPGQESQAWEAAARADAARVAILPLASSWLAERLGRLGAGGVGGHVVGVLGGSGGAGASTLSCWLALHASSSGMSTLLVDGDPFGGGLELAVGSESVPGVRWEDLGEVRGTLNPEQLAGSLPSAGDFALLSVGTRTAHDPGLFASQAVPPVMEAAKKAFDLTVVDLARGWFPEGSLLPFCDSVALMVPGRLRSIASARSMAAFLEPLPVWPVVRGPLEAGLDPQRVSTAAVGHPLAAYLPHIRGMAGAEAHGRLLEAGHRRSVRKAVTALLAALAGERKAT